jgi:hypothetical protein
VVNTTPRPLYLLERDQELILQEALWAPRSVCTGMEKRESLVLGEVRAPERPARKRSLYQLRYHPPPPCPSTMKQQLISFCKLAFTLKEGNTVCQTIGERVYTSVYVCHLIIAEKNYHSLSACHHSGHYVVPVSCLVTVCSSVNMTVLTKNNVADSTLETFAVGQLFKKFPAFYETQ